MSLTITLGWWLAPTLGTLLLFVLAAVASNWLGNGDGDSAGLIMFPVSAVALFLSGLLWLAYFFWPFGEAA